MIKRFLAFVLSFALIFSTTSSAYAVTSVGGWTATDSLIAGANTTINATKTAGGKVLNSAVTVGASAAKVGKHLIKGGGQAALAYAVVELLGEGIDWVLDPANNRVKYLSPDSDVPVGGFWFQYGSKKSHSPVVAANERIRELVAEVSSRNYVYDYDNCPVVPKSNGSCVVNYIATHNKNSPFSVPIQYFVTDVPIEPDYKYIPIETVAAKVIANAVAGHAPSQEAVKATALEGFAAGEYDAALDAAAEAAPDTDTPTDPENPPAPDTPLPFDPSSIIAAINALKALLAGILSSITGLADFFKGEPEVDPDGTELDIPIPDIEPTDTDISFGGSCPSAFAYKGSIFGNPIEITLFDTPQICDFLSTYIKYPVYALSSLYAIYIVGGRRDV